MSALYINYGNVMTVYKQLFNLTIYKNYSVPKHFSIKFWNDSGTKLKASVTDLHLFCQLM